MVLLHGVTDNRRIMRGIADKLGFNSALVDLRGHGDSRSRAPWTVEQHVVDLWHTLDELGIVQPILVGHSFGGLVAARGVAERPGAVAGLVLVDPAIGVAATYAAERRAEVESPRRWPAPGAALAELLPNVESRGSARAEAFMRNDRSGGVELPYDPRAAAAAWAEMGDTRVDLSNVRCDVGVMVAERGSMLARAAHARLAVDLGERLHTVIVDSSHELILERPETVVAATSTVAEGVAREVAQL